MCMTIYGSKRDFRADMQSPYSPARAHAMCRRLVATANQMSLWYGAHYWAACAATSQDNWLGDSLVRHRDRFYREACGEGEPTKAAQKLWDIAMRRVFNLRGEALQLKTSVLW